MLPFMEIGLKLLDKIVPDPAAKEAAKLKLLDMQQAGDFKQIEADLQLAQMQADINKVEAGSSNLFVSGWRPGVGWTCVAALCYQYLARPFMVTFDLPAPEIDLGDLIVILLGMLGLSGLRTTEKIRGVTK